jgi:hypothetical protein
MIKTVTICALTFVSFSAFAGRSVAVLENETGKRVVIESEPQSNGLSTFKFYSCVNQTSTQLDQLDLKACDKIASGKSFTLSNLVVAIANSGGRNPFRFLFADTFYGLREAARWSSNQPVNGLEETTYIGSAEGYSLAIKPSWFLASVERSLVSSNSTPGIVVGRGASGYYEGVRDGITALLMYSNK